MSDTTTAVVDVDFEYEADRRQIAAMDDETLIYSMLGLNAEMEGAPNWGLTPEARMFRRLLFTEIVARWVPLDVFGAAFRRLMESDEHGESQDCRDCGEPFPYDPDADRCPVCVAASLGEEA